MNTSEYLSGQTASASPAYYRIVGRKLDDRGKPYDITKPLKKVLVHEPTYEWKFGNYQSARWQEWMTQHAKPHNITPDWAKRIRIRMGRSY